MKPVLLWIGNFPLSSYYVMAVIGVIVGFFITIKESDRLGLERNITVNLAFWTTITGFIGARIQHIIFDGFFDIYLKHPMAMLYVWKGGLAFYGSVVFGMLTLVAYLHFHKKSILKYLDAFSYAVAFGVSIGRVGCFLNGCCFGQITSSSIGIRFLKYGISAKNQFARNIIPNLNQQPLPVIPTQLISWFVNLLIFLFLYLYVRHNYKKTGTPFGLWLILYAIFRFIIEFFRADARGLFFNNTISTSQIIALLGIIVGFLIIWLPSENDTKKQQTTNLKNG